MTNKFRNGSLLDIFTLESFTFVTGVEYNCIRDGKFTSDTRKWKKCLYTNVTSKLEVISSRIGKQFEKHMLFLLLSSPFLNHQSRIRRDILFFHLTVWNTREEGKKARMKGREGIPAVCYALKYLWPVSRSVFIGCRLVNGAKEYYKAEIRPTRRSFAFYFRCSDRYFTQSCQSWLPMALRGLVALPAFQYHDSSY